MNGLQEAPYLVGLNEDQRDAVLSDENLLLCAGPGSGKTRVLIKKTEHILRSNERARIVLTTFSKDAAKELMERVKLALPRSSNRIVVGTYHSLGLRQLRTVKAVGRILSTIEAHHMLQRVADLLGLDHEPEDMEVIVDRAQGDPSYLEKFPDDRPILELYQKGKKEKGVIDFQDIIMEATARMQAGTLKPIKGTHFLCDEFQDIDLLQYRWLMENLKQGAIGCAVGDDDQSVFGFRRSLGYRGMMDFAKDTGARTIVLGTNYRSTPEIVDTANRLIGVNLDRVPKNIRADRQSGPAPKVVVVPNEDAQIDKVIEELDRICSKNPNPPTQNGYGYRFTVKKGQVAILARTNAHLMKFERAFLESRIPFIKAGPRIWDGKMIQVMVALLLSLHNKDGVGIEVALRWAKASSLDVQDLVEDAGGNLWSILDPDQPQPDLPDHAALEDFVRLGRVWVKNLRAGGGDNAVNGVIYGVAGWMKAVLEGTCGLNEDSGALSKRTVDATIKIDTVRDILDNLRGPLPYRIQTATSEKEDNFPRVVLSTFHASKGLEYDHVLVVYVITGVVPKIDPADPEEAVEEERRVFYVAITRPKNELTIYTQPGDRWSEFLYDAGFVPPAAHGGQVTTDK